MRVIAIRHKARFGVAVAAVVEAVPVGLAGGGGQWRHAAQHRERGF